MTMKNKDVMEKISQMLKSLSNTDKELCDIVKDLLAEVYAEHNAYSSKNIPDMLYEWIDRGAKNIKHLDKK